MNEKPLIAIVGPTAVGKTELSIKLAKALNGEVINGDAFQIYRGLDIGTAKVTEEEKEGVVHHLIDVYEPDEPYSVYQFKQDFERIVKDIHDRGKLPILVGGTGLYVQSVLYDYNLEEEKISSEKMEITKNKLNKLSKLSNIELHNYLHGIDPKTASSVHPNNRKRVERAIEYYLNTKKTLSERKKSQTFTGKYSTILIGIEMSRETLYQRINMRVDMMLERGLLREVSNLVEKGYQNSQSMQAIGYKELVPVVKGEIDIEISTEQIKQNSRRYAKRQMTWFKNKMNVTWFQRDKQSLTEIADNVIQLSK
ncbi:MULTISPECIES: tRNA (adenosine(37)-N6)-dimethylallyltransferase MiaA [Mammaliicoccus]|uniref:tRNA dimethylallyltransferase n=1 Tax=Mammaliicoccus sciuri TaxID=1296 RepID=A0AAW5LP08_MAMSC|nr:MULTISPECIES: tRNA (adenosine(37)-N6)-dimethylallyltransferase MiaA [Mammaliicoccus]MBG9209936.1 tRNA (adenosine(37)-N6)-dimethylallyltransferase MiaA [Mammaliicoccus sciuri]MCD5140649.1 tRNA (adenosine(37)-N6)-dimethylallyltransferase MiaA [Mammaliicoccus sciuri]MCQ9304169.1 tRNA (adenosine(37)-N6)-dimethylallyltransferase MiaA [Mammaliicoccus sciuri]MDT0745117.1 tRNA (adenosine(37)-N6)-dimethylallyltransferase MiaA [Mammaliicoccus sciuri]MDT0751788.1 tRNA (adenosine(37)-N6)-dimethylallylt